MQEFNLFFNKYSVKSCFYRTKTANIKIINVVWFTYAYIKKKIGTTFLYYLNICHILL